MAAADEDQVVSGIRHTFSPTLQVSRAVRESLMTRSADFGIVLEDVAITHLSFGSEFTRAVEAKQVAEQDAERARFVVLKAEQVRCMVAT